MQAIRQHQLDILTKGQIAAMKSEAEKQQIEAEKAVRATNAAKRLQGILGLSDEERVRKIRGLGDTSFRALSEGGYATLESIAEATIEKLAEDTELLDRKAKQIIYGAKQEIKDEAEIRELAEQYEIEVVDGIAKLPFDEEAEAEAEAEAGVEAEAEAGVEAEASEKEDSSETDASKKENEDVELNAELSAQSDSAEEAVSAEDI